jgi:hypothetical protein
MPSGDHRAQNIDVFAFEMTLSARDLPLPANERNHIWFRNFAAQKKGPWKDTVCFLPGPSYPQASRGILLDQR